MTQNELEILRKARRVLNKTCRKHAECKFCEFKFTSVHCEWLIDQFSIMVDDFNKRARQVRKEFGK